MDLFLLGNTPLIHELLTLFLFEYCCRPIVTHFLNGDKNAAMEQWKYCLPLINHENRQCGLRATKTVMKEGGVIQSDHVRHPQKPMSERTKATLLQLAKEMDLISLKWGK